MNWSKEHINWITVGEVINVIKKPVALYTTHIVERWHVTLLKNCKSLGQCRNSETCQEKMKPSNLCPSCNGWYKELAKSHRNTNKRKIEWRKNCDTSKFPLDAWEVAKFFMPVLGDNKVNVINAASTDLSYLLNVLTWMKDVAFAPDRRVDLDLVKNLRSEVRNLWAHEPNQELTDDDFNNAFDIANKFIADLDNVFSCNEVKKCIEDIKFTQTNKISNDGEAELKAWNSQRDALAADISQLKKEVHHLKDEKSFERQVLEELEKKLEKLVNDQQESSIRMNRSDRLFCREISEIHAKIKSLQKTNNPLKKQLKSCIPDKPPNVFGRDAEIEKIVFSLVDDDCGIVSIVGGPGFGKSTLATEVSHRLSDSHDIVVIFSFLSNASTVPEVIQRLCRDVDVDPGDDPESSLISRLKNSDKRVVLVMDNIEQLLKNKVILDEFIDFVKTLRKNSQQQILTTTRTEFSVLGTPVENVPVRELNENASVEFLRNCCGNKEVKDETISDLAKLCGFVPLALCITGSIIPWVDDPTKLIKWLREEPMETLQSTDESQSVRKSFEVCFQMLSEEDQKAFARLSVFNGSFHSESAKEVIEKNDRETQFLLSRLVARSLVQTSSDKRYMIHSLIRRYLTDHNQLKDERAIAQGLMVKHFLKMCHLRTLDSNTKDGFTSAREKLKKDSHNVEETFKLCSEDQAKDFNPNIIESLKSSDIYKSSSRFFFNFGWDIIPLALLRSFFKYCLKLAEGGEQPAIQISFEYIVADLEGRRAGWKSPGYKDRMKALKKTFDENDAVLKEDWPLYLFCYYFYARYSSQATHEPYPDLLEDNLNLLCKNDLMQNAEQAVILIQRARLSWFRAKYEKGRKNRDYEDYMNCAKSFFNQALSIAEELLGDHELTGRCHKALGVFYSHWQKDEEAIGYFSDAIKLSKKLQLDSNESFVNLLRIYGLSLRYLGRFEASVENLIKARDIIDNLAESHTPCRANVYSLLAETYRAWKPDCKEAAKYAKVAIEMKVSWGSFKLQTLKDIIKTAENTM